MSTRALFLSNSTTEIVNHKCVRLSSMASQCHHIFNLIPLHVAVLLLLNCALECSPELSAMGKLILYHIDQIIMICDLNHMQKIACMRVCVRAHAYLHVRVRVCVRACVCNVCVRVCMSFSA